MEKIKELYISCHCFSQNSFFKCWQCKKKQTNTVSPGFYLPAIRKRPPPALYKRWPANGAAQMMMKPPITTAATAMSIKTLQKPL